MRRHTPTLLTTLLLCGAVGAAQGGEPVSTKLTMLAVRAVTTQGKTTEKLLPNPASVNPGDVLSQMISVKNASAKAVRNYAVQLPVPKSTVYLAPEKGLDSASAKTTYSIDSGKTFAAAPLKKTITVTENGKSVQKEVEVKPSEYNAVRWTVAELAPGKSLELGYRIQVK